MDPLGFKARDMLFNLSAPLAIIGGLNWLHTGASNLMSDNAVVVPDLLNRLGLPAKLVNILYILVGISSLFLAFALAWNNFWAPDSLDDAFFPSTLTVAERSPPGANTATKVQTTPFAKVAFWAAQSPANDDAEPFANPNEAYGSFDNSGVAIADANGVATLRVRKPSAYYVPRMMSNKLLEPHIHYRIARAPQKDADGNDVDAKRYETHVWSVVHTAKELETFA